MAVNIANNPYLRGYEDNAQTVRGHVQSELGMASEEFKDSVQILAFRSPAAYQKVRGRYIEFINQMVVELHDKCYNFLTTGKESTANDAPYIISNPDLQLANIVPGGFGGDELAKLIPHYSAAEAKRIALGLANSVKEILKEQFIDEVFSGNVFKDALARARTQQA